MNNVETLEVLSEFVGRLESALKVKPNHIVTLMEQKYIQDLLDALRSWMPVELIEPDQWDDWLVAICSRCGTGIASVNQPHTLAHCVISLQLKISQLERQQRWDNREMVQSIDEMTARLQKMRSEIIGF